MLGLRAGDMTHFVPWLELLSFCPPLGQKFRPSYLPWWQVDVTYPHYHITPLATATFFCSQCGRYGEVRLRNNCVFVPNRLLSLFARRPEMTRPSPQKSALREWDTRSFLGVQSIISSFFDIEGTHFSMRRWRLPQRGAQ